MASSESELLELGGDNSTGSVATAGGLVFALGVPATDLPVDLRAVGVRGLGGAGVAGELRAAAGGALGSAAVVGAAAGGTGRTVAAAGIVGDELAANC